MAEENKPENSSAPLPAPVSADGYDERAQIILVHPLTPTLQKIKETQAQNTDVVISEAGSAQEAIQVAQMLKPCVLIAAIVQNTDIMKLLNMVTTIKKDVHAGRIKAVIFSAIKQQQIVGKFEALGVHEFIVEPVPERQVNFKLNLQIKANKAARKKQKVDELKKFSGSEKKAEGAVGLEMRDSDPKKEGKPGETSKEAPANEVEADVWLFKNHKPKKQGSKWAFRLEGPDPSEGKWEKVPSPVEGDSQWRFMPKNPEDAKKGSWEYTGEEPTHDSQGWNFNGKNPQLSFVKPDGKKEIDKVTTDAEGNLITAKDSAVALQKEETRKEEVEKKKNEKKAALLGNQKTEKKDEDSKKKTSAKADDDDGDIEEEESLEELPEIDKEKKAKESKKEKTEEEDVAETRQSERGWKSKKKDDEEEEGSSGKKEEELPEINNLSLGGSERQAEFNDLLDDENAGKEKKSLKKTAEKNKVAQDEDDSAGFLDEIDEKKSNKKQDSDFEEELPDFNNLLNGKKPKDKNAKKAEGKGASGADSLEDRDDEDKGGDGDDEGLSGLGNKKGSAEKKNAKTPGKSAKEKNADGEELDELEALDLSKKNKPSLNKKDRAAKAEEELEELDDLEGLKSPANKKARKDDDDEEGSLPELSDEEDPESDNLDGKDKNFLKKEKKQKKVDEEEMGEAHSSLTDDAGPKKTKWGGRDSGAAPDDEDEDHLNIERDSSRRLNNKTKEEVFKEFPFSHFGPPDGAWEPAGVDDRTPNKKKVYLFLKPEIKMKLVEDVTQSPPYWICFEKPLRSEKKKAWLFKENDPEKFDDFKKLPLSVQTFLLELSKISKKKNSDEEEKKTSHEDEDPDEEPSDKGADEKSELEEVSTAAAKKRKDDDEDEWDEDLSLKEEDKKDEFEDLDLKKSDKKRKSEEVLSDEEDEEGLAAAAQELDQKAEEKLGIAPGSEQDAEEQPEIAQKKPGMTTERLKPLSFILQMSEYVMNSKITMEEGMNRFCEMISQGFNGAVAHLFIISAPGMLQLIAKKSVDESKPENNLYTLKGAFSLQEIMLIAESHKNGGIRSHIEDNRIKGLCAPIPLKQGVLGYILILGIDHGVEKLSEDLTYLKLTGLSSKGFIQGYRRESGSQAA